MSTNVLQQTEGHEVHLASNQIVSKVMESLLGFAEPKILETYFKAFFEDIRPIFSDHFASYVLQKLVEVALLRSVRKDQVINDDFDGDEDDNHDNSPKKQKFRSFNNSENNELNEEWYNLNTNFSEEHRSNCSNFVLRIGKFVLNNLENFVWDQCGNHIIRTCLLSLVGIYSPKETFKQQTTDTIMKHKKRYKVPNEWIEIAIEYGGRIGMWPQFPELPYQDQPAGLLGVICLVLRTVNNALFQQFADKIIEAFAPLDSSDLTKEEPNTMDTSFDASDSSDDDDDDDDDSDSDSSSGDESGKEDIAEQLSTMTLVNFPKVFNYRSSIVLLETIIKLCDPNYMAKIYRLLFSGRVRYLAQEQLTNFAVQKFLQRITSKEDFESMFDQLSDHLLELINLGQTGIVQSLTAACLRLQCKQGGLFNALQKALHILHHKERTSAFFRCLLALKPFEHLKDDNEGHYFVHLHGSLIIQDILYFHRPAFLVNCILETAPSKLVSIFTSANGSFIANAFMESKYVGEKSREKLLHHLENYYSELAVSRYGSRVLEVCFQAATNDNLKVKIAKELVVNANQLKSTSYGKIIYQKLHLDTFRLSVDKWKTTIKKSGGSKRKAEQTFESYMEH